MPVGRVQGTRSELDERCIVFKAIQKVRSGSFGLGCWSCTVAQQGVVLLR